MLGLRGMLWRCAVWCRVGRRGVAWGVIVMCCGVGGVARWVMAWCGVVWAWCGDEWCRRAEVLAGWRIDGGTWGSRCPSGLAWRCLWGLLPFAAFRRCARCEARMFVCVLELRGMLWRCVVCGVVPCRVAWCGVWCGCDVPRCRVTWCDVVVTWCGAVSCGAWCGAAWCGARQRGLAW